MEVIWLCPGTSFSAGAGVEPIMFPCCTWRRMWPQTSCGKRVECPNFVLLLTKAHFKTRFHGRTQNVLVGRSSSHRRRTTIRDLCEVGLHLVRPSHVELRCPPDGGAAGRLPLRLARARPRLPEDSTGTRTGSPARSCEPPLGQPRRAAARRTASLPPRPARDRFRAARPLAAVRSPSDFPQYVHAAEPSSSRAALGGLGGLGAATAAPEPLSSRGGLPRPAHELAGEAGAASD